MANNLGGGTSGLTAITSGTPNAGIGNVGQGVYWVGADNNIYTKVSGQNGVKNIGPVGVAALPKGLSEIANPNPPKASSSSSTGPNGEGSSSSSSTGSSSGSYSSGGSSSGSSTNDPDAVAYYTDLINQLTTQLNGAKGEQGTGLANINNAYNEALNNTNTAQSNALSSLATQGSENGQARENNIGSINQNANQAYNSLMALLGASGAGVSSAATTNVPYAVAQNASGQRAGANTTYNTNKNSIDSATTTTKQQYQTALDDLLNQKNSNTENFMSGLLGQEGQLEQQIAAAQINRGEQGGQSYTQAAQGAGDTTSAINDIQGQLNNIFAQYATPTYTVNPVSVTQPNLTTYSVDPTTVAAQTSSPNVDAAFAPYLQQLQTQPNILTDSTGTSK